MQKTSLLKRCGRLLLRSSIDSPPVESGLVATQSLIVRVLGLLPAIHQQSPKMARFSYRLLCAMYGGDLLEMTTVKNDKINVGPGTAIDVRIYIPEACSERDDNPALLYFHGGGCVIGDLDTHDDLCRLAAHHSECIVLSIGYRLAPEHPFPIPLEDALHAWNWVCQEASNLTVNLQRTGVGGDSAGGLLATSVCQ